MERDSSDSSPTIPYLVPDPLNNAFWVATAIAGLVLFFELWAIAFIRERYMDTPFLQAVLQIVLGGAVVWQSAFLLAQRSMDRQALDLFQPAQPAGARA